MAELKLNHVNKIYPGGVQAVYDFNIEIEHGEFIVLVGPSGCGKSTILRMIAGLESVTDGDLLLADERINDVAPADRDISMVFQNYALYGHMSVYQNMGFSQILRQEDADVVHAGVMRASAVVELNEQLNRFPKNLSGGQRQRVAMGRAIVGQANIILMDEPLSNLDAKLRVQSRRELIKLHQRLGNTFIYVTHDQTEAITMADRIVVMNGGRVQQIGTPADVYQKPENLFVGGFIGSPSMNFIQGKIESGYFIAPGIKLAIPQNLLDLVENYPGDKIVLGFRPEHFSAEPNEFSGTVRAKVLSSEFLGNHSMIYLQITGADFVANLKQNFTEFIGDSFDFYIDMRHAHFFDPKTEKRLRLDGEQ